MLELQTNQGHRKRARALLDSCSESTFVSHRLARQCNLTLERSSLSVMGIAGNVTSSSKALARIQICTPEETLHTIAHVLRHIGITTPSRSPQLLDSTLFSDLKLADPQFTEPRGVDLVIGAHVYARIVRPGVIHRGDLLAQKTAFGWTITGGHSSSSESSMVSAATFQESHSESGLDQLVGLMQKFWAVEEIPQAVRVSQDDLDCEDCYEQLHSRDSNGRYIVPLPIKEDSLNLLGESLTQARIALRSAHRRMRTDSSLCSQYVAFMDEYLRLGHMRTLSQCEIKSRDPKVNYIPHHAIWQRADDGRRLRVVFNASCSTSTGYSLNDTLYSGPKLQNDLVSVVTRWRRHRIAFCADIQKMFRQILVRSEDTHLKRIIWSKDDSEPEVHFALLTVTYGEASAPYLALRTLMQLCKDEGATYPEAADAIHRDLYVDDFLTGGENEEIARDRRDQLIQLLRAGGFTLKKWVSNSPNLLSDLPAEDLLRPSWLHFMTEGPVTELGLAWDPNTDAFRFAPPTFDETKSLTKRSVLSDMARLFDPAGWLAPIIVSAKMFIQDLWRAKFTWDEVLPALTSKRWTRFRTDLADISSITLPRWLQSTASSEYELHSFADASRRAFAAVVYVKIKDSSGVNHISLVRAKTKLSPIRSLVPPEHKSNRMTIPRLELRAALLAVRLLQTVTSSLQLSNARCYLWSDSSTVLRWIDSREPIGNALVDNYVHSIQESMPRRIWRYVPSGGNPADVSTRGIRPAELRQHSLWWNGPTWLTQSLESWPPQPSSSRMSIDQTPGVITSPKTTCLVAQLSNNTFIDQFSSLMGLMRAVARSRRFTTTLLNRIRSRSLEESRVLSGNSVAPIDVSTLQPLAPLKAHELQQAFLDCVKICQARSFPTEIDALRRKQPIKLSSPLSRLGIFLDETGTLRVGGRLRHSSLPHEEKHPPVLDKDCHLAKLVVDWAHSRALHAGFRSTCVHVMRKVWIVRGEALIKRQIRKCAVCIRASARTMTQAMAPLPASRVTPARPFSKTGVDYAGTFQILRSKGRGAKSEKGYVAVFVCLATKAIHLELVGDLTTASFLGALARFAGRRGRPKEIWSDNATNFHGADHEFRQLMAAVTHNWDTVANKLAEEEIE